MSPWVFTGTVVSTERDGRVAAVQTDGGHRVEVVGTTSTSTNGLTSVYRDFEIGARYEFHPANSTSPFQDDTCTRTHLISPPPAATTPGTARGVRLASAGPADAVQPRAHDEARAVVARTESAQGSALEPLLPVDVPVTEAVGGCDLPAVCLMITISP